MKNYLMVRLLIFLFLSLFSAQAEDEFRNKWKLTQGQYTMSLTGSMGQYELDSDWIQKGRAIELISSRSGNVQFVMRGGEIDEKSFWLSYQNEERELQLIGYIDSEEKASGNYLSVVNGKKQDEGQFKLSKKLKYDLKEDEGKTNQRIDDIELKITERKNNRYGLLDILMENKGDNQYGQLYFTVYAWNADGSLASKITREIFKIHNTIKTTIQGDRVVAELESLSSLSDFSPPFIKGAKLRFAFHFDEMSNLSDIARYTYKLESE